LDADNEVAEYISGQKSSGQPERLQPELFKNKSTHQWLRQ
jgi:hypothetical protein